ncbi:Uncharacterised protein [Legionella taurinensis]|uniref:hypothetical protein n=1 Tax=Legionella taurinensis TaxID=70611 RepID=UPI000E00B0C1|nr:hypothetical protein [Legionella taurinensis]STY25162.1 Uncharacterised protein [Legionella taurinensis]
MELNAWFLGAVGILIILLSGLIIFFIKHKKTMHFYIAIIVTLILAAIFLYGVSFRLP